jgi:hypothetical protein
MITIKIHRNYGIEWILRRKQGLRGVVSLAEGIRDNRKGDECSPRQDGERGVSLVCARRGEMRRGPWINA